MNISVWTCYPPILTVQLSLNLTRQRFDLLSKSLQLPLRTWGKHQQIMWTLRVVTLKTRDSLSATKYIVHLTVKDFQNFQKCGDFKFCLYRNSQYPNVYRLMAWTNTLTVVRQRLGQHSFLFVLQVRHHLFEAVQPLVDFLNLRLGNEAEALFKCAFSCRGNRSTGSLIDRFIGEFICQANMPNMLWFHSLKRKDIAAFPF